MFVPIRVSIVDAEHKHLRRGTLAGKVRYGDLLPVCFRVLRDCSVSLGIPLTLSLSFCLTDCLSVLFLISLCFICRFLWLVGCFFFVYQFLSCLFFAPAFPRLRARPSRTLPSPITLITLPSPVAPTSLFPRPAWTRTVATVRSLLRSQAKVVVVSIVVPTVSPPKRSLE